MCTAVKLRHSNINSAWTYYVKEVVLLEVL